MADRSAYAAVNDLDQSLMRRMRSRGTLPRDVGLYHARMSAEPLLWSADIVAWSVRRTLTHDETYRLADLHAALTLVEARTGKILNIGKPQAGAVSEPITPGAREPVGPSRAGGALVTSSLDPTPGGGNGQVLSDLAAVRDREGHPRSCTDSPPRNDLKDGYQGVSEFAVHLVDDENTLEVDGVAVSPNWVRAYIKDHRPYGGIVQRTELLFPREEVLAILSFTDTLRGSRDATQAWKERANAELTAVESAWEHLSNTPPPE